MAKGSGDLDQGAGKELCSCHGRSPGGGDFKLGSRGWEGICQMNGGYQGDTVPGRVNGMCKGPEDGRADTSPSLRQVGCVEWAEQRP